MTAGAYVLKLALGTRVLDLMDFDNNGFIISEVDLGGPIPRKVVADIPGQDGQQDDTAYFSGRTIQLNGAIVPTVNGLSRTRAKDKLAPFLWPGVEPTLLYAMDFDVDVRCFGLKVGNLSNPIDHPVNASAFSVQWTCPDPISYGVPTNEVDLTVVAGSSVGFSFPISFPLAFGTSMGPSSGSAVLIGGTYPTWPVLRFFGPITAPSLVFFDGAGNPTGTQVMFTNGLTIAAGDYLEVDTKNKTAVINGDPMASRYNFLDFANTVWGQLFPGPNVLRYSASGGSPSSTCAVLWRDAFLD